MIEVMKKILFFLYWEGTVNEDYLTVDKIHEETDLSVDNIQDGLRNLGYSRYVDYVYMGQGVGIVKAKITSKGIRKTIELLNETGKPNLSMSDVQ